MKIPRDLSGREVATTLVRRLGYQIVHERVGKLNAIFRAVALHKHIEKDRIISL
jgi:hypothetical protein